MTVISLVIGVVIGLALANPKQPRYISFYLEPKGSHDTNPFDEQDPGDGGG